jgi:small-conductance mechanosensitive channel
MEGKMLASVLKSIGGYFSAELLTNVLVVLAVLVVGFVFARLLSGLAGRVARRYLSQQYGMLLRKAVYYGIAVLILIVVLQMLGVKVTALLGAAGIAGIAIGFASQTSFSNLISGLFLISEKTFQVGDVIRVGDKTGIVQSIDLLSVKMNTFDNLFLRIPNEQLIKTELTNITRYPIRRLDIKLGVAYKSDINRVKQLLREVAAANPYCLMEPEPLIVFTDFGDSALQFLFGLWFYKTDYLALKNSVMQEIKEAFDAAGIEIPFPHISVYSGSATDPFPVAVRPPDGRGRTRKPASPG